MRGPTAASAIAVNRRYLIPDSSGDRGPSHTPVRIPLEPDN